MPNHYEAVQGEVVVCNNRTWECILTQTNVKLGRNCWFKIKLVLLNGVYIVAYHGGRVGNNTRVTQSSFKNDLEKAKLYFLKKYSEKTMNNFLSDKFQYVPDMYDLVPVPKNDDTVSKNDSKDSFLEFSSIPDMKHFLYRSTLEEWILYFYGRTCVTALHSFPKEQLESAIEILEKIKQLLPTLKNDPHDAQFIRACNEFYQKIPHLSNNAVMLSDETKLTSKIELLMRLDRDGEATDSLQQLLSPLVDSYFSTLKNKVSILPNDSSEYHAIERVLECTHGPSHKNFKLELIDIHKIERNENISADVVENTRDSRLLWHGSSLKNFTGILRDGLKIAPPNVPSHGHMFGKGIYFATVPSKSAGYCSYTRQNNIGILALCSIRYSSITVINTAMRHAKSLLPSSEYGIIKAEGFYRCSSKLKLIDDSLSCGPLVPIFDDPDEIAKYNGLLYKEFVVYNEDLVQLQYLLRVRFIENVAK